MRYSSSVQWNQRMRKTRSARPCVTRTRFVLLAKRPALMSRIMWSLMRDRVEVIEWMLQRQCDTTVQ